MDRDGRRGREGERADMTPRSLADISHDCREGMGRQVSGGGGILGRIRQSASFPERVSEPGAIKESGFEEAVGSA